MYVPIYTVYAIIVIPQQHTHYHSSAITTHAPSYPGHDNILLILTWATGDTYLVPTEVGTMQVSLVQNTYLLLTQQVDYPLGYSYVNLDHHDSSHYLLLLFKSINVSLLYFLVFFTVSGFFVKAS